jgi:RNA polymerase sigma factor (sigma-70 family)
MVVPAPPESTEIVGDFATFYRHELSGQVRRATMLVGDAEAARDLVHDAFADVYARWGKLREPGAYLNVAVLNRCRDHARRATRAVRRLRLLVPDAAPEDEVLWDAVQRLPFNQRAAIVLRYYHRMTEQEIAVALGCRTGSVGPWLHRGLGRLREELQ